jgi:hypothetical protein
MPLPNIDLGGTPQGTAPTTNQKTQLRTAMGATTTGDAFFTVTNPGAITFVRVNANNSITLLSASDFRTATGTLAASGGTATNITITNFTESPVVIGTVTTSNTIDLATGTLQTATLTASTECTFTMPTATAGKSFTLLLKQAAATGLGTAVFTGVKWSGGTAPEITATAGKMDILTFVADGTNWYGSAIQNFTP